ncbi:MAG: D-alanyl-D-alanine carboxypeptidase [Solirubrobacterales bacterium]|nr:D-alanyl-D-alanine carboxypeptidase [Solirubrobacterales bacterium]
MTNAPSDNFLAEMLLKNLGAKLGGGGTTAAGAGVVRRAMADKFGLRPRFDDGSGLSRYDSTSPRQVVTLLRRMAGHSVFVHSLAIAGETGTLIDEMRGTSAQGRCRGKTGTLYDVASLAGYCRARDGHTLAFAFLMNRLRTRTSVTPSRRAWRSRWPTTTVDTRSNGSDRIGRLGTAAVDQLAEPVLVDHGYAEPLRLD